MGDKMEAVTHGLRRFDPEAGLAAAVSEMGGDAAIWSPVLQAIYSRRDSEALASHLEEIARQVRASGL